MVLIFNYFSHFSLVYKNIKIAGNNLLTYTLSHFTGHHTKALFYALVVFLIKVDVNKSGRK